MPCKFIARPPQIVGAYMTDHSKIAPVQKDQAFWVNDSEKFLPILNLFNLNERAEVRLADTQNASNDIETYNPQDIRYTLSPNVVANNRLNVSSGDLLTGGVRFVLNFMDQPIITKTRADIPKLFMPLNNVQLKEWAGKLLVLSFHSYNIPQTIKEISGIANYFENLRTEKIQRGEGKSTPARMLEYLSRCWQSYKPAAGGVVLSNSIKLVMVHEYVPSDFMDRGVESDVLYCSESGLSFRRSSNVLDVPVHPKHNDTLLANREIVESMRDNGVSCFIVDNNKLLSDRFINFVGNVRKIEQIVDYNRPDGLYITTLDGQKSLGVDSFIPITDIDTCRYIYRSHEEALQGADIRQQAVQAHEINKLEMSVEAAELNRDAMHDRHQYEERIRVLDAENKRQQADADMRMRAIELKHQQDLRDYKLQEVSNKAWLNNEKYRFDMIGMENKHHYESVKYERDSSIETLKTVGSVAGLLAGGFVLFKQISK